MNKNLLSFLSAAVMALCFPLAAGAAVYNVTWGEPENGQLSVSTGYPSARLESDAEVGAGSTLYVNAVPGSGYYLASLTANGSDILSSHQFTVTADTEVEATFEPIPSGSCLVRYLVSSLADIQVTCGGEAVYASGIVPSGSSLTVNVVPSSEVTLGAITVGGQTFTNGGSVTVSDETSIEYQITSTDVIVNYVYDQGNGQITMNTIVDGNIYSTIQPGVEGDNVVQTMTEMWICAVPAAGYVLENVYVNGVPQVIEELEVNNPFFGTQYYWGARVFALSNPTMDVTASFKVDDGSGPGTSAVSAAPEVQLTTYDNTTCTLTTAEDVVVYSVSGQAVLRVAAGSQASLDMLPGGVYVAKGAQGTLKFVR